MGKINYNQHFWEGTGNQKIREVKTDLDPSDVNDLLLETFKKWIEFAMGTRSLGGRKLKNPSGKMATALKADMDPSGNVVALYIDPEMANDSSNKYANLSANSNDFVMSGHKRIYLKRTMLQVGRDGVRRSKEGYLYRYIPIANKPKSPGKIFRDAEQLKNLLTVSKTDRGKVMGINKNAGKMWLSNYANAHSNSYGARKIRVMSNRPGSARWEIPAMKPFSVSRLLKEMLPPKLKDRVII